MGLIIHSVELEKILNKTNPNPIQGNKPMKKNILLASLAVSILSILPAQSGVTIFGSYVGLKLNESVSVSWYGAQEWGTDIQNLGGASLGTFNWTTSPNSLLLDAFQVHTAKWDAGDITGANLYYRIFKSDETPTSFRPAVTASFISNSPFTGAQGSTASGGGDQNWGSNGGLAINLLSGISTAGTYNLEFYFDATSNEGTQYSNAGGANYIASFNAIPEPSSSLLMGLGLAGLAVLRRVRKST